MENNKKRKLSGTILAGTFAVPAALSTAQQNITSANLFTDVCSSVSSFFTKKAEESTFSFLASRIGTCIGITVLLAGIYMLYKGLFPEKKNEPINKNTKKNEETKKVKSEEVTRDILKGVLNQLEVYIKEFIREKIKEIFNAQEENENLVSEIYKQLDLGKIKKDHLNTEDMLNKNKEDAKTIAVNIVKNKIKETYKKDVEEFVKETKDKIEKIQTAYRGKKFRKLAAEKKIIKIYEENKGFLDNFKISKDLALSFEITFDKDVEKNENNENLVDVSVKKENDTIKVTFKRGKEEKTLDIEKSKGGLKTLNALVELPIKQKIFDLYRGKNEQLLKKFDIVGNKAECFVKFNKELKDEKVNVTSKRDGEKITFAFKNGNDEKTLEIPVTKEGYNKLEELITLAKDYDNKKAKKENEENDLDTNINNENIINKEKEEEEVQENNKKVKDENFEKFKEFKETFKYYFNVVKKNDTGNYLTLTELNDNSIALKYTSNMRYEYPLSISYDISKGKFKLHYEWTDDWWRKQTYDNDELESVKKATEWFLKKFKTMYDYATRGNLTYKYDEDNILESFYDGKQLVDVTASNSDIKVSNDIN